jgi:hypothetical protein
MNSFTDSTRLAATATAIFCDLVVGPSLFEIANREPDVGLDRIFESLDGPRGRLAIEMREAQLESLRTTVEAEIPRHPRAVDAVFEARPERAARSSSVCRAEIDTHDQVRGRSRRR